ncbi:MAG TPA: hypothetical protein VJS66_05905 [Burkholderiales bacterium]|nr:hypothetical protein [Burkholderiales bacterium]
MIVCDPQMLLALEALLARYGLQLMQHAPAADIPGSYWGAPEAGLIGTAVHVRVDTPLHSALHEAAHVVCMNGARRAALDTDAGGEHSEEDAVCYLQILLARELGVPVSAMCADMDEWGYTFRLGSAQVWFTQDAQDARQWLIAHGLVTETGVPTWRSRDSTPTASVGIVFE